MSIDLAAERFAMPLSDFHPLIRRWFVEKFGEPTEPQRLGWPQIARGRSTLIAAPTGSGKTLSAFLVCIDRLFKQHLAGDLPERLEVLYISPLKALSNDIERNLRGPLAEIRKLAGEEGFGEPPIRAAVRTGDTPSSERQSLLRRPPHILATTPETLYLLLTSERGREHLRQVRTVIVDEIHALARDKRGSHLSLSLERLEALCGRPPVRIGLSATQRPIDEIAHFLVGSGRPTPEIVDAGHFRDLNLAIETPLSELSAVCSLEQWEEVYARLLELIGSHRSTLIFVNTRRLAERVAHRLTELLGGDAVASHHGSLSRSIRLSAEQRLKSGELKAIVATASLEMGIDVGFIDLVCQIGSPRSIATFLQRVGRSGHSLKATPKGRLFPLTIDELLECMALIRSVGRGELDRIEPPVAPLDILAQQVVAAVAAEEWSEEELFELVRKAWPYRDLTKSDFERIAALVSEGVAPTNRRGAWLHRDRIGGRLRPRRGARLAALTSGGAIPETAEYRVVTEGEKTFVGTVDEDFAIESMAGDVFLLGNTSWRVRYVRGGEVVVNDAQGAPPTIPFWLGEGPGRTIELSHEVSRLRREIAHRGREAPPAENGAADERAEADDISWLRETCGVGPDAAGQAADYVRSQLAATGVIPTVEEILFERFFDESGGMQLVIHAPLGARINRAWGLALRKRFCRSFDFELQAAATDNGVLLSLSPQHSFPVDKMFQMLRTDNARHLLEQALLAAPMFQVRWRWNATRALVVLRMQGGKKVPPYLQRFRSDDLLAAVFPETVGCLENHHGDVQIPDHPLVRQTMHDCLHEAMDVDRWLELLGDIESGRIKLVGRDTREPSPFCGELLNANPYAFLDDAPLEERRTRAVAARRSPSVGEYADLARLDPDAIAEVRRQAWPVVRDADELHDALLSMALADEGDVLSWRPWLEELVAAGRATRLTPPGCSRVFWVAAERLLLAQAVFGGAQADPPLELPEALREEWTSAAALVEIIRGRMSHSGPARAAELAAQLGLERELVFAGLEALEGEGAVLRGCFTEQARQRDQQDPKNQDPRNTEWCDRRLLARIHRLTLQGLRDSIRPVSVEVFLRFLAQRHRLTGGKGWHGPGGVREAVARLEGFEMPAAAWEQALAARVEDYSPLWLDQLFVSGELVWGRLRPPRTAGDAPSAAGMTRAVPISLMSREHLGAYLGSLHPSGGDAAARPLRHGARQVLDALIRRGALFHRELVSETGLLATQLEDALRELAAAGRITCDGFEAVRAIIRPKRTSRSRRGDRAFQAASQVGRWSLFPGPIEPAGRDETVSRWCEVLLARYGVLFRDLLSRETAAPAWREILPQLRRMELRGELRGGRFVEGVSGEQFAATEAVESLRRLRDATEETGWFAVSAADPLNLFGVLTKDARIPAMHTGAIAIRSGRLLARLQSAGVEMIGDSSPDEAREIGRALHRGRRESPSHSAPPAARSFDMAPV